jgi:beta-lactamase regulating signal transducer with metallopeptidase domain
MSFFHLPNEDYVRTQTNYTEIFALTLLWNVGLLGMLVAFLFVVFLALKMYQLKILHKSNSRLRDSLLTSESRQQSQRIS